MNEIAGFYGPYRYLSNFWECKVPYEGVDYITSEHAFQAAKTLDPAERHRVACKLTPRDAKFAGQNVTLRHDWEKVKLQVMEDVVRAKFDANPDLKRALTDTGDAVLIEANTHGDRYWGQVDGVGESHLGKILMKVRQDYQQSI